MLITRVPSAQTSGLQVKRHDYVKRARRREISCIDGKRIAAGIGSPRVSQRSITVDSLWQNAVLQRPAFVDLIDKRRVRLHTFVEEQLCRVVQYRSAHAECIVTAFRGVDQPQPGREI